jgi:hypothetical protein
MEQEVWKSIAVKGELSKVSVAASILHRQGKHCLKGDHKTQRPYLHTHITFELQCNMPFWCLHQSSWNTPHRDGGFHLKKTNTHTSKGIPIADSKEDGKY